MNNHDNSNDKSKNSFYIGVRVLGGVGIIKYLVEFIKGLLVGNFFGIDLSVDLYYVGKSIPDYLSSLLGTATYNSVLPQYSSNPKEKVLLSVLLPTIIIGGLIFWGVSVFSEEIINIFFGYDSNNKVFAAVILKLFLLVGFIRIIFDLIKSFFYSSDQFLIPSVLTILTPLIAIVAMILMRKELGIKVVAYGSLIGAFLGVLLLLYALLKVSDFQFKLGIDINISKKVFFILIPIALGSLAYQLNIIVDRTFASALPTGSVSALQYGYTILTIPHLIINFPINDTLFPRISRVAGKQDFQQLQHLLRKFLRIFVVFSLFIQWNLLFYRVEIIRFIYGEGAFDARAIEMTSTALLFYSLGYVFLPVNGLLVRFLMSLQYKRVLILLGVVSILLNYSGDWLLSRLLNLSGISLTTTLVNFSWFLIAYFFLTKKLRYDFNKRERSYYLKIILYSFLSVSCSYFVTSYLIDKIHLGLRWSNGFILLLGGVFGVFIYGLLISKTDEFRMLKLEALNMVMPTKLKSLRLKRNKNRDFE